MKLPRKLALELTRQAVSDLYHGSPAQRESASAYLAGPTLPAICQSIGWDVGAVRSVIDAGRAGIRHPRTRFVRGRL